MNLDPIEVKIPTLIKGEDKEIELKLIQSKAVNLTSVTEIEASLANADGTLLVKRLTTSDIVVVSAINGFIKVIISSSESLLLQESGDGLYSDIEVSYVISGKKTIIIFNGIVKIINRRFITN